METVKHNTKSLEEAKNTVAKKHGQPYWNLAAYNTSTELLKLFDEVAIEYASSLTQQVEELTRENGELSQSLNLLRMGIDGLEDLRDEENETLKSEIEELKKERETMIQNIITEINGYWRFDNNQQPLSGWHEKQDLLEKIAALNSPSKQGE